MYQAYHMCTVRGFGTHILVFHVLCSQQKHILNLGEHVWLI